tara:strand:+ start:4108 stop:5994 length:1887 start_codon:yes stop_codon:yes gene_type:complete
LSCIRPPEDTWILPEPVNPEQIEEIELSDPIKSILLRRGYKNLEMVNKFLFPTQLPDAYSHFPELNKAVERIRAARLINEKIAICGDYDADGMTSSALLKEALNRIGTKHEVHIPNRLEEGYGLNESMIRELHSRDIGLIITVDNGVSAQPALELANELGIDIIITDHHKIPDQINNIFALIHPEQTPTDSPYRFLAGVGLAYILSVKIFENFNLDHQLNLCLDLFCIGTIADMTPLYGANRYLLKKGLNKLHSSNSKAILALLKSSGIRDRKVNSQDIAFKVAPRINSIGRISSPHIIIDLFTESSTNKLKEIINIIEKTNLERRNLTEKTYTQALNLLTESSIDHQLFILLVGEDWHAGIIGLIASRILETFKRPVAVLTKTTNNIYRASARAPKGFHLINSLDQCKDLLETYGGHKAAAGFTVKQSNIPELSSRLSKISQSYSKKVFSSLISPDSYLAFNDLNINLLNELDKLEPFGVGNPKPLFWSREVLINNIIKLGNKHVKLILNQNGTLIEAIHWNYDYIYTVNMKLDIAYYVEKDRFNTNKIQLIIKSSRPFTSKVNLKFGNQIYTCYRLNNVDYVLENKLGDVIKSNNISSLLKKSNNSSRKYIQSLVEYSQIALGITY